MKIAANYIDLDDQIRPVTRLSHPATPEQAYPSQVPAQQYAPPSRKVRGWVAAGCAFAIPILFSIFLNQASMSGDVAAMLAAWLLLALGIGIGITIIGSWLAMKVADKAGYTRIEQPALDSVKWAWRKIPLYPHLGTRYLVRAMKQHPAVRYRFVLSFKECKLGTFAARA